MRKILLVFIVAAALSIVAYYHFQSKPPLIRAAADLESLVSAGRIQKQITELASKPHRAGSENNKAVGDAIVLRLQAAGLDVTTKEYPVEFPEPAESRLELIHPEKIDLVVKEKAFPQDPYSQIASEDIPYFAFSPDADIESEVVYANFGSKQDFELLKKNGIDVTGKLVLVRAQGICRGMKLMNAEEFGAAGLLLFPELRDQGFKKAAYPEGPHINPWVIQRGSMLKFFLYPGEPSVSVDGNESTLPKIPSMPLSEEIAVQLLNRIDGNPAPEDWRGWLPTKYEMGMGPAKVRFIVRGKRNKGMMRNIFATISGSNSMEPDLMIGGHYDAWVYGAADPSSGTSVLLEAADALAQMGKRDWTPRRNIVFAFWDAEEFGLFGSTKWVENALDTKKQIMAYINVDTAVKGQDFAGYVVPGLQAPLDQVLNLIRHPITNEFLSERRGEFQWPGFSDDTAPFTGIAGVPVAEIHFGRVYPMYHSIYDDLTWMERFDDPGYRLSTALAKVLGLYIVKLGGDPIFPYQFTELGEYARNSISEIVTKEYDADPVIRQKLEKLKIVLDQFEQTARDLHVASGVGNKRNSDEVLKVNKLIQRAIASFTKEPHPSEPFHGYATKNVLLGPSEKDGCSGQPLPALQRAVSSRNSRNVGDEMDRLIRNFC